MTQIPFSVLDEKTNKLELVLAIRADGALLLVRPDQSLHWKQAEGCKLGTVYFDRPWHAPFTQPVAEPDHEQ